MSERSEVGDVSGPRLVRSALYLDFDNVYSGLCRVDRGAATAFANNPGLLLDWLGAGEDDAGAFRRRFLVRDCYLNPQEYAWCRAQFVAAGFRVIDCPSLTQKGKSSADTHIVLDVVEALNHATRYDEFVICPADADFSPLMTKLRRHDRRTVMVAAGPFATAYESVCDTTIGPMQLVEAFTRRPEVQIQQFGGPAVSDAAIAAAATAIREAVRVSPLPGAAAAGAAQRAVPGIAAAGWGAPGGFAAFVGRELPELQLVRNASGGWIVDPTHHTPADIPTDDALPDDVIASVCRVSRAPRLSSDQYAMLFTELVEVGKVQPLLGRLGADVRDRVASSGVAAVVSRTAVNVVVTGLVYSGADPREGKLSPRELAQRWRDNVLELCRRAGMLLNEADSAALDTWILGGLPSPA